MADSMKSLEVVRELDSKRWSPSAIDVFSSTDGFNPQRVVMTSIGSKYRSAITPYYPGIQMDWGLTDRIGDAFQSDRQFVEAEIRLGRKLDVVRVSLRIAGFPDQPDFIQSSWQFSLERPTDTSNTWDLLEALGDADSEALPALSGLVAVTHERISSSNPNWQVHRRIEPEVALAAISQGIDSQIAFE